MTTTTESGGRQNMFPSETRPYIDESVSYDGYPQNAEKVNGRWAMIGFRCTHRCILQPQVKSFQAYSNGHKTSLLEVRRTSQWSSCDALGLVIGTINYGLFGWIAPGLF
ncbi:MAG: hypothetical protein CM15mV22_0550 [Eurybiavirus sp.]|nr:MAG: hypothetical protein CM15mV22_0550 [Eurybiavirus sp.]